MNEYNLIGAGLFTETDLLDFQVSEENKGKNVRKIYISKQQANYLMNRAYGLKPKNTGMKLVDYWNTPTQPIEIKSIDGILVEVED